MQCAPPARFAKSSAFGCVRDGSLVPLPDLPEVPEFFVAEWDNDKLPSIIRVDGVRHSIVLQPCGEEVTLQRAMAIHNTADAVAHLGILPQHLSDAVQVVSAAPACEVDDLLAALAVVRPPCLAVAQADQMIRAAYWATRHADEAVRRQCSRISSIYEVFGWTVVFLKLR